MIPELPVTARTVRIVLAAGVLLSLVHSGLFLFLRRARAWIPEPLHGLFNVAHETGLLTWLTVSISALLGLTCLLLAQGPRRAGWIVTGLLFLGLSMDDACMLHERSGELILPALQGGAVYSWLIVLGPVLALFGLLALGHLWCALDERGERARILAGFGCLAAALLLEAAAKPLLDSTREWRGAPLAYYPIPLEELLELVGPTLLLACTLGRLERRWQATLATDAEHGPSRPSSSRAA